MTDYKQLCAELVAAWDDLPWQYNWKGDLTGIDGYPPDDSAVERARAALAEPEPEGPTDEELFDVAGAYAEDNGLIGLYNAPDFARAVLARWSSHPGSPDSPTPQPVPLSERLPGPENCNSNGECWWLHPGDEDCGAFWTLFDGHYRGGYTHWLPANALPLPS